MITDILTVLALFLIECKILKQIYYFQQQVLL